MPTLPKRHRFVIIWMYTNIIRISAYDYRVHEYRLYIYDMLIVLYYNIVYIVLYICLIYFVTFAKPIHAERLAGLDVLNISESSKRKFYEFSIVFLNWFVWFKNGLFRHVDLIFHFSVCQENTPKEGVQLMMAPVKGDIVADMPEVAAVLHPVAVPSLKELLSEEGRAVTRCDKMWQDCTNETTPIRTFQECGFWLIEICRKIEIHLGTRVDIFRQWATLVLRPSQASKQILQVQGFDAQQENNRKTFRSHHVITCSYIVLRFEFVDSELHLDLVDSCWFLFCMQVIGKDRKAKVVASRWLYPWLRSRKSWTRSGMPWKLVSKLKDRFCRQLKTIEKSNDYQIINNLVSWQKLFWFWEHKHGWHDDDMMTTWWRHDDDMHGPDVLTAHGNHGKAPIEELALQAAERLDGLKLDGNAWCSLADRLRALAHCVCQ